MIAPYTFVFVSHVSEDSAAATAMVANLEARGIACWIAPRDVNPGRPFDTEIADAIETCRVMLLLFSERCNESEYIRREVTVAGEVGKVIIPYRIEEARPKGALRVRLSDLHWIDAFEAPDRAFDELVCTMLPDGERSGTRFPVASQLTTSTSVILPEAVPAQEVAPAAQTETERIGERIDAEIRANNYVDMGVTSDSAAEEAPLCMIGTSPPSAPLASQVSPAHIGADGTVEWIEQLRRRRDPPTGRYLARPARAAARRIWLLIAWLCVNVALGRRTIHAAGIVSVIALSVLTPVGIYLTAVPQIVTKQEERDPLIEMTHYRVASGSSERGADRPPVGGTAAEAASAGPKKTQERIEPGSQQAAITSDEAVPAYKPVGTETIYRNQTIVYRQEPSPVADARAAQVGASADQEDEAVPYTPRAVQTVRSVNPSPQEINGASAPAPSELGGFKLAAAGLVTAVMTKVSDFPAPVAQAQAGPIRKPAFLAKLFGGGEEAHEETVAAPAPTRTAVPAKSVRGGWMIQVGAYPAEHDAKQRLDAVQSKASKLLGSAHPFTDTVDKGGTTYYRARFAGLDQDKAEAACQYLKSDGVDCIMIKN